jgi:hypothetical protein
MCTTACGPWMMSSCDDRPTLPARHKRRIRYRTASEWPCGTRLIEVGVEYAGISIVVACEIRFGVAKRAPIGL